MSGRKHLAWVSAAATLLAAAPLISIFEAWTWLLDCGITVAAIAGAATLSRSLRAPLWAQLLSMAGTLLLMLTWLFPSGEEILALLPTTKTFGHFGDLMNQATQDVRGYGVPVPDRPGLLFLTALGVGSVAILVDLLTVSLRRPALAGLPMLAIYSVPVAVFPDSVPMLPFVIGSVGFLWLLIADNVDRVRRFGRRFTGDGRDVDVWEPSPLAAAGRRLAVVGVALAVMVPLAVPGMTTGLIDRFGAAGAGAGLGGGGGSGGGVNLFAELRGKLNQSDVTDLVKVTTNERFPYYMKFAVSDQVTTRGFVNRSLAGQAVTRGLPEPVSAPGVTSRRYHAKVEVTGAFRMAMAPSYTRTVRTEGLDSRWFYDQNADVVFSHRSSVAGKKYEFDYVRSTYTQEALRQAKPLSPNNPIQQRFSAVPDVREVTELVADLTKGKQTQYDKVRALYDYFSPTRFSYGTDTGEGTSGIDIVNFLNNRVGFCVQYAAALAWLTRAAGFPARVAFGFANGNRRDGNTYVLTTRNLHAWTEIYFDGFGWIPFDATPSASVPGSAPSAWAPDSSAPIISPSTPGQTAAPEEIPGQEQPDETDPRLADRAGQTGGGGGGIRPSADNWPWWSVGAAVLLLALLAVPALRRALLRRRRRPRIAPTSPAATAPGMAGASPGEMHILVEDPGRARQDAHAAWEELLDTLVDYRVSVDPAETPRATAERLVAGATLGEEAADGARLLGRAEERARYARSPMTPTGLGRALRTVRRALRDRANRRTRLLATVLPPSVLLRWRRAIVESGTRVVVTAGRVSQWPSRLSPRRLIASRANR